MADALPAKQYGPMDIGEMFHDVQPLKADFRNLGTTGLRQNGGILTESTMRGLDGKQAIEVYKEMGDNDPACGIILFLMQNIVRSVSWLVRDPSDDPRDMEATDFVRTCMHDMDTPWDDVISEALSMVQYGFAPLETIYKRRAGRSEDGWLKSKYSDGRIGWRGFPLRSQDTLYKWEFDTAGTLTGMWQFDPFGTGKPPVLIPFDKLLLFRTSSHKNNPEGVSAFRRCYRPWYFKRSIEETEAIGIERDLAGMPVMWLPPEVMADNANPRLKALHQSFKDICTKVRRDELEGVLMPLAYDDAGNKMFDFQLMASAGSRQFDTSKIIDRLNGEIFRTALADFLVLGQGSNTSGSWALSTDKTQLFMLSLKAYLTQIKNVFNLYAIPRLLELNGMEVTDFPQIDHTPIEQVDMKGLAESISALAMAGMPLFPNPDVERRLMEILGLPVPLDTDRQRRTHETMPARTADSSANLEEIHPDTPASRAADSLPLGGPSRAKPLFREPVHADRARGVR